MVLMLGISVILIIFAVIFFIGYIIENIELYKYYNKGTVTYGLERLANDLMLLFTVIVPLIISWLNAAFAVIARTVYLPGNFKKLKNYKKISNIGYCFMLISCFIYSCILAFLIREDIMTITAVSFYICVIAAAAAGIINTKRISDKE